MASELRVNTLKDASGNNSVGMSYVAQGSTKAWINFNGETVTAAADLTGVRDSFNIASLVDNDPGDYTVNFSSAFLAADYNTTYSGGGNLPYLDTSYGYTPSAKTIRSGYPSSLVGNITLGDGNDMNTSHNGVLA